MVLGRGFKRFPLPMALGNDICRISRIRNALGRGPNKAARFIQRVLTKEEIRGVRDPKVKQWIQDVMSYNKDKAEDKGSILSWVEPMSDDSIKRTSVYLAGRWAAKEAVIKAHPYRRVLFEDILIYSSPESLRRHGKEGESKTKKEGQAEGEEVTTSKEENDNNMAKEEEKNEVVDDKEGDEVDTRSLGRPVAVVRGRKEIGEEDTEVLISISHDHEYATAVCLSWTDSSSKRGGGRRKEKKPKKATRRRTEQTKREKPEQTMRRETEKAMRRQLAEDIVEIGSYTEYLR